MRLALLAAAALGLLAAPPTASAQPLRTGPEANKYLFMFYAIDDMAREFNPGNVEEMRKNSDATVYADRLGAMYTKRKMILNSFRRHSDNIKLDAKVQDAIEETGNLMKHVGAYYDKVKEAQNHYDLGFRSIQAKLFTDAELKDKMLQSFVDAESYYLSVVDRKDRKYKSDYTMYGITRSLKRRAVYEYQVAKTKQKLAEDVHRACLKYEAENRPALEAKLESIHRDFMADYEKVHTEAVAAITGKFKPLAATMGLSESQVVMAAGKKDYDLTKDSKDRPRDPFRLLALARMTKIESPSEAKKVHQFARDCLMALEWIPVGSERDTTEVFFYYRGLLAGWAGTLATKAAAVDLGTEGLEKAYHDPSAVAQTACFCWRTYAPYEKSGAFPKSHYVAQYVMAQAYAGKVQEGILFANKSGERIDDPNYWYVLARMCGVYKYGNQRNIENFYAQGIAHLREAMLLGFTGVEEARQCPDFIKIRENKRLAEKLSQAMFEPDNLFKLAKLDRDAKK